MRERLKFSTRENKHYFFSKKMENRLNKATEFFTLISFCFILISSCSSKDSTNKKLYGDPEQLYGPLFYAVQNEAIFTDSKTFVDCIPKYDVSAILTKYKQLKNPNDKNQLKEFVLENFIVPSNGKKYVPDSLPINEHINDLWNVLIRNPDKPSIGTYIPLPKPYIVPGGRFQEIYYWDSYFTMLGLQADGKIDMIRNMIDNFAYLIDKFGFIPNGNRTYYLGRSQAPFFTEMVELLSESDGEKTFTKYLPEMQKEYNFWMNGDSLLNKKHPAYRRVVLLSNGEILNRYWDDRNSPRSESYREDVMTGKVAQKNNRKIKPTEVYRNLRAGAESGWDFSSRWLTKIGNEYPLYTIHTTDFIPVDLNCLIYKMELTLAKAYEIQNNKKESINYLTKAKKRAKAIIQYCWNKNGKFFFDYNFKENKQSNAFTLAGTFPLYVKIADNNQAKSVADVLERKFLCTGGLSTTIVLTSQQWDAPNGWAPLQWVSINGLRNYGFTFLADSCKKNWLKTNELVYNKTFKLTEKYNVMEPGKIGEGGEYAGQDGFGWSNGVYQKLSKESN